MMKLLRTAALTTTCLIGLSALAYAQTSSSTTGLGSSSTGSGSVRNVNRHRWLVRGRRRGRGHKLDPRSRQHFRRRRLDGYVARDRWLRRRRCERRFGFHPGPGEYVDRSQWHHGHVPRDRWFGRWQCFRLGLDTGPRQHGHRLGRRRYLDRAPAAPLRARRTSPNTSRTAGRCGSFRTALLLFSGGPNASFLYFIGGPMLGASAAMAQTSSSSSSSSSTNSAGVSVNSGQPVPSNCKVVELQKGERPPQGGGVSTSITAGNGKVSGSTSTGGTTLQSGSGSGSFATSSSTVDGKTVVTDLSGGCTVYRTKEN